MTMQTKEILYFKGVKTAIISTPFHQYLKIRPDIKLKFPSTACWRGYYGKWELDKNRLYLIDLVAYIKDYKEIGIEDLFNKKGKIFANWFTGEIQIMTGYCDDIFDSEMDIELHFKNGNLIGENKIEKFDEF